MALMIISASFTLGGCLNLFFGHREQVRRYTKVIALLFWVAFVVSIGAFLCSGVTLVVEYGIRGPSILAFSAALFSTVFWLGGHYLSSDHSKRPRTTGGKILAVLWLVFCLIVFLFIWTFVAAGSGDKLPKWSDFLFLIALLWLSGRLHEIFAHQKRIRTPGFWKGTALASTIFVASIAWVIWDSLGGGTG